MKRFLLLLIGIISCFSCNVFALENNQENSYLSEYYIESKILEYDNATLVEVTGDENGIYVLTREYNSNNENISVLRMLDYDFKEIWKTEYAADMNYNGLFIDSKGRLIIYGRDTDTTLLAGTKGFATYNIIENNTGKIIGGVFQIDAFGSLDNVPSYFSEVPEMEEIEDGYVFTGEGPGRRFDGTAYSGVVWRGCLKAGKNAYLIGTRSFALGTKANEFIALGSSSNKIYLYKNGSKDYFEVTGITPNDLDFGSSNNYYVGGASDNIATLMNYDFSGSVLWKKQLSDYSESKFIDVDTKDDKIIVVGKAKIAEENDDAIMAIYNDKGEIIYKNTFGGKYSENMANFNFINDDYFITGGTTTSNCLDHSCTDESESVSRVFLVLGANYNISVNESEEGRVFTDKSDGKGYVVVTPNSGYLIDKIIVKDDKGNELVVTLVENNKYSFDLNSDVEVTVEYKPDYKVTLNVGDNGNATFDKTDEEHGRVNVSPKDGYEVDEVIIKDTTGKMIVYELKDSSYYFEIKDHLVVNITFKELSKEVVKGEEENPQTADAFIYYVCAVVSSLFGIWSVEQYRKTKVKQG